MRQVFCDFSVLHQLPFKKPLLVCDDAFDLLNVDLPGEYVQFREFTSNPRLEDAQAGAALMRESGCDFMIAVGGGSSIDTAKAIKHLSGFPIPLMAVPTTSGTGSESTHFAAVYRDGEKESIADERLLPDYVILEPKLLKTLPLYQKKCTMLDALCQAIESWWSRKATVESIGYAEKAIRLILNHMDGYLSNEDASNKEMLTASNFAGRAINITTTTAPHAMSYKLTSLYALPHGHAVAICLPKVWRHMGGFDGIAKALGCEDGAQAVLCLEQLLQKLEITPPAMARDGDLEILTHSVNAQRLQNHPIPLDKSTVRALYKEILEV